MRLIRSATYVCLFISWAVLIGCGTSPRAAQDAGVDWLVENQNPDGSWGSFDTGRTREVFLGTLGSHDGFSLACAALGTMALIEPSREDADAYDALIDGMQLLINADPVGRARPDTFYDTWAHTYMIQCLAMLHADDRLVEFRDAIAPVLEREIKIMVDRQSIDGGWAYYDFGHSQVRPTGNISTSFNTGAALVAFYYARQAGFDVPQVTIDAAIDAVARLRFPQGAYGYSFGHRLAPQGRANKIQGSIGRAQVCNLALYLWDRDLTQQDLLQGIEDLRKWHYHILIGKGRPMPHEAWYATAGYYFLFGHYYAGMVLEHLPEPDREDHARWLAETMAELNEADGSWFDFPLYGYYKAYGTAFGVMTLQHAEAAREN